MTTITPPPSRIYLLRHAKSGWAQPGQHDFDRALDNQGFAEAEVVSDRAADRNYRPDVLISSTALRCKQTAEAVRRAMDEELEPIFVDELYNGSLGIYIALLDAQKGSRSVMIVGHNPTMEELLEALIGPDAMVAAIPGGYPPAGLAVLDYRGLVAGSSAAWVLTDFITA
jgi:phosphohistidine phosphatase